MNLPPSTFADLFRANVVPKLRGMIESRGLFVALGMDDYGDALSEINREAVRLGATYLPKEHYEVFLDWTQTALLQSVIAAEQRHDLT